MMFTNLRLWWHTRRLLNESAGWFAGPDARRESAVQALAKLGDKRAAPSLIQVLESGVHYHSVVDALAQLGDPRAIDPLISALGREQKDASDFKKPESDGLFNAWMDSRSGILGGSAAVSAMMSADADSFSETICDALGTLTGQKFGVSHSKWREWWKTHQHEVLE